MLLLTLSWICFAVSLLLPFQNASSWIPSVMGPVLVCSFVCVVFLFMQVKNVMCYGRDDFWGKAFILWSMFHMIATFMYIVPFMFIHFLWVFSAVCWQVTNELIATPV